MNRQVEGQSFLTVNMTVDGCPRYFGDIPKQHFAETLSHTLLIIFNKVCNVAFL